MFKNEVLLPSAEEVLKLVPINEKLANIKNKRDAKIKEVFEGKTNQMILIIGPCSAHDPVSTVDYVERIAKVQEKVKDKLLIIPRIYTNKPRTKGIGYKGMFSEPNADNKTDILKGILQIRKMHIDTIEKTGLTSADEMLYPENYAYVEDILSYVSIGARSSENQMHRLVSSGIEMPVGIKNPMSGSFEVMFNSIYAAQNSHTFKYHNHQVTTDGNPLSHAILRGYVDSFGNNIPNFHYENLMDAIELYQKYKLKNPTLIIDANHSNSNKDHKQQIRIIHEVMQNRKYSESIKKYVKGFMVESFIEDGCQKDNLVYGKSITDSCLGFAETEKLIYSLAEKV